MSYPAPPVKLVIAGRRPAFALRALLVALVSAALFAGILGYRIGELDEAVSERTSAIVMIAAVAGFLAGGFFAICSGWLLWRWPRWLTLPLLLVLLAGAFFVGFAAVFAIDIRFIHGQLDAEPYTAEWFRELVFSPLGALGMFLQTGTRYLLPWPAALTALLTAPLIAFSLTGRAPRSA
jgi:hypothetical protein